MPIALIPTETWEYQLKKDRKLTGAGDPSGTWFQLSALTPTDDGEIQDGIAKFELAGRGFQAVELKVGTQALLVLERALKGWRNFRTAEGADVEFKTRRANGKLVCDVDASLAYLSSEDRRELADAALERTKVTVEQSD